jgi:cation diffusion facilitator family transporter
MNSDNRHISASRRAMFLSLGVGFAMLAGKVAAWRITGSAAILSDAAESVVHVVAVAFATFSLRLSYRPANSRFLYGYERISFFSAGFEGAMIILAAVFIVVEAVERWIAGRGPENLGEGIALVVAASLVNLALGVYLVRTGRRAGSLILEANGKHVLTDSWTSFGVVVGLLLVIWTGWKPFDPLVAIVVALNILISGWRLVWGSVRGLLDYADPDVKRQITDELDKICSELGVRYHELRFRSTGTRVLIEVHLLFPYRIALGHAHSLATEVERRLTASLPFAAEVMSHLESVEDHDVVHGVENSSPSDFSASQRKATD